MGNVQPNECRSICGFNILSTKDLRRSSLQNPQVHRKKPKSHTMIPTITTDLHPIHETTTPKKDDKSPGFFKRRNCPAGAKRHHTYHLAVKEAKDKPTITEQDFRIVQVNEILRAFSHLCRFFQIETMVKYVLPNWRIKMTYF